LGEERKFATVLFADIVGSTALGESHDPEVVRETLSRTFATWRQILTSHGGTVEKFIGDAVMAVFGVPSAHEDDAERAVRAAFAIRECAREGTGGPMSLDVRVGITSGEVVGGGGGGGELLVTGASVNAAARLQQAAAPGELLVGSVTRDLTSHTVRYGEPRRVEAKGMGGLEAFPAEDLLSELPALRPAPELSAPLVGRDRELRLLETTLERVAEERRAYVMTVFGSAGVGKSRLAQEWISRHHEGALVGRCLPYGEGITFWPVREMLYTDAGIHPTDTRDEVKARIRTAVLRAFGASDPDAEPVARRLTVLAGNVGAEEALPDVHPSNVAPELRWAMRRYVERRAADRPVVLVFEDVQWAEPALLDLIEHIAEWTRAPVFVLCLARPELLDARPSWGGGKTNAAALALEPLSAADTRRLIQALLGATDLPTELADDVCARAEGNPLYVEEFLRMMIDSARITRVDGQWLMARALPAMAMPPTLQGIIAARLDTVPPDVKRILQHSAVIGKRFWTTALAALSGGPVDEAPLLDAIRRGLIFDCDERGLEGGRSYEFRHSLMRNVAYGGVPKGERLRLHDAFAGWLEGVARDRVGEYADTIAYHAEQAFGLARELGSPRAAALGQRAYALLLAAATRARRRADLNSAQALYARAAASGEAAGMPLGERVEAEGFAALSGYYVEGTAEALARLDRAIEAARAAGPSEVLVRLLSQRGFIARKDSSADAYFDEGIAVARATGDPHLIAHAMVLSNAQPWTRGDLETHRRILEEAYAFMKASDARAELGICLVWLATNALQRGDFGGAQRFLEEAAQAAEASGSKFQQWAVARARSREAIARGEHVNGVRFANDALALAIEVGARRLIGLAHARLGDALFEAGEPAQSRTVLEQGRATVDRETMREAFVEIEWKLARAALAASDRSAALAHALAAREAAGHDLYSRATTAATLATVRAAEGDRVAADLLWREALALVEPTGYGALLADVRRDLGRALVQWGHVDEGRPLLEAARAFYADPLAERRRAEIDAILMAGAEPAAV